MLYSSPFPYFVSFINSRQCNLEYRCGNQFSCAADSSLRSSRNSSTTTWVTDFHQTSAVQTSAKTSASRSELQFSCIKYIIPQTICSTLIVWQVLQSSSSIHISFLFYHLRYSTKKLKAYLCRSQCSFHSLESAARFILFYLLCV